MKLVIVGAGFAGISTAYHLARRRVGEIMVLERELGPGHHASGQNAGLLRQSCHDQALVPLMRAGARAARRFLARIPGALMPSGSLIMGRGIDRLHAGARAEYLDPATIVPGLEGRALFDPQDCIIDPHTLLLEYERGARERGVEFAFGEEVCGIGVEDGRVAAVSTGQRTIAARGLVVAAGAWASQVAAFAGSRRIEITPYRRHIFRGHLDGREVAEWPFVWDEERGVYFLPEGDGLLLSPCDVDAHPMREAVFCRDARDLLATKLQEAFGNLGKWRLGPGWACLRSMATDRRFVIGRDPDVQGLFWVAGLGGHGVTSSWAVGKLAADVLTGRADPGPFDPKRF